MKLKKGCERLLAEANAVIETIGAEEAIALHGDPDMVIVDLRDDREREQNGSIPGAFHAPRGMLEFLVDPESPYHKEIFASGKRFVFHCGSGGRSALATKTVKDMGLAPVCHIDGGFKAWREAGGPVEGGPAAAPIEEKG